MQMFLPYPWFHHMARLGLIYVAESLLQTDAIHSASSLGDHHLVQRVLSHCWPHSSGYGGSDQPLAHLMIMNQTPGVALSPS